MPEGKVRLRWEALFDDQGNVETHVLERLEGANCGVIRQLTDRIGTEISGENTGPDVDDVHEVQF